MTRRWLLGIALAAIAIAAVALRPARTPGPIARDFEAYWSAGSTWNERADPYGRAIWPAERRVPGVDGARDELLPFVGPPPTLLLWSVFARMPYAVAARMWWAILALSLLALAAAALRGCGARVGLFPLASALALAVAFAPTTSDLALGQLALPSFLGAVVLCVFADRFLALGTLAACVAFAQPNAALGLASRLGRNGATLALLAGAAITYALGAISSGWSWPLPYVRVTLAHAAAERFAAIQFGPAAIAYGFGATPRIAAAVGIFATIIAIVAAIVVEVRVADPFARFAAFSALAPFVAGFFHEHDFVVAYAAALWCALRARAALRAVALGATLLVAVDWLGLAQRPSGIAQSALLATAALAAFLALGESERRSSVAASLVLAVVFIAAGWLAVVYPAPIWPDALGMFHAPAGASAALVWRDEQGASGLFAAVPAWALLRSLSLLGCALLAYVIYRDPKRCRTA